MSDETKLAGLTATRDGSVLRRVSNLGSARSGLAGWRAQRLSALALIPLSLLFVTAVLHLATTNQDTAPHWLAQPYNALLMLLFVFAIFTHALVGLRSIYADYVHGRGTLLTVNVLTRGAVIVLSSASTLAILKALFNYRGVS